MTSFRSPFSIAVNYSGSTTDDRTMFNFLYTSTSYQNVETSGSIAAIVAKYTEANITGSRGELIFKSSNSDLTTTGSAILRLFHTGSNDEPRVGIGIDENESIDKTLEIRTKKDSAEGSELVLEGSRTTTGAQVGDEAGRINFVINSGSFNNKFSSGSIAKIKTDVKSVNATGVTGRLVLGVSKDSNQEPLDLWTIGYNDGTTGGVLPSILGMTNVFTGSIQLTDLTSGQESSFSLTDSDSTITYAVQNRNNTQGKADMYLTGDITASGHISASGKFIGSELSALGDLTLAGRS